MMSNGSSTANNASFPSPAPVEEFSRPAQSAPIDAVVATIQAEGQVLAAQLDLVEQGVPAGDIKVYPPRRGGPRHTIEAAEEDQQDIVSLVRKGLRYVFVEEAPWEEQLAAEQRQGGWVILVHAANSANADVITAVLGRHNAHLVRVFNEGHSTDMAAMTPASRGADTAELFPAGTMPGIVDLADIDFLRGLESQDLQKVAALSLMTTVPHGTVLGRQNEQGRSVFMVLRGEAELTAHTPQGEVAIRIAGRHESFPLTSLIGTEPLITTATAMTEELQLIQIPCEVLKDLCDGEPRIGLHIYRAIAQILGSRYRTTLARLTTNLDETVQDIASSRESRERLALWLRWARSKDALETSTPKTLGTPGEETLRLRSAMFHPASLKTTAP